MPLGIVNQSKITEVTETVQNFMSTQKHLLYFIIDQVFHPSGPQRRWRAEIGSSSCCEWASSTFYWHFGCPNTVFKPALIVREAAPGIGQFAELRAYCFNRMSGVNDIVNRLRIAERVASESCFNNGAKTLSFPLMACPDWTALRASLTSKGSVTINSRYSIMLKVKELTQNF